MAIDLPPNEIIDGPPPAAYQGASGEVLTLRDESRDHHYRVHGHERNDDRGAIRKALQAGEDPAAALLALARRKGLVNVRVARIDRGATTELWLIAEGLSGLAAPDPLRPYFEKFVGDGPIRLSRFERSRRLAELHARRTGFATLSAYDGEGPRPTMRIKVRDQRDSNWDYQAWLGNTGNRYLGRWFSSLGAAHVASNSRRIGGTVTTALTALGDNDTDASYGKLAVFIDRVRPWGVLRWDASYGEARYDDNGAGRRLSLQELIGPQPRNRARYIDTQLGGEHFIGFTRSWSWSLRESIGASDYQRERVEPEQGTIAEERYYHAAVGLSGRWNPAEADGDPILFVDGGFRQGLDADKLSEDAETGFRILQGGLGGAINLGGLGRVMAEYRGQYAFNALPEGEEFVLGGIDRMNAWLPGVVVGDIGFLARAQWRAPQMTFGRVALEPLLAYEHGQTEYVRRGESGRDIAVLADAAVGFDAALKGSAWQLKLRGAKPVRSQGRDPELFERLRSDFFVQLSRPFGG